MAPKQEKLNIPINAQLVRTLIKPDLLNCCNHLYLGKLVVEVHIPSTQVASQQCGVGGEDGGNSQLPLSTQN